MLPIASQTAGPIGLKICVDTHGWLGGVKGKKKIRIFFFQFFSKIFFLFLKFFFSIFFSTGNFGS